MHTFALTAAALALTAGIAAASPFNLIDRNDDGSVSTAEFTKVYGPELEAFDFRIVDGNHDGVIDAAEFADARFAPTGILNDE